MWNAGLDLPATISHSFFLLSGAVLIGGLQHVTISDVRIGTVRCRFTVYYEIQDPGTLLQALGLNIIDYGEYIVPKQTNHDQTDWVQ